MNKQAKHPVDHVWRRVGVRGAGARITTAAVATICAIAVGLLWAVAPGPALARDALGISSGPESLIEQPLPPPRATHTTPCARARALAERLGETFAGYRIRETLVARTCAFALQDRATTTLWDWPWRLLAHDAAVVQNNPDDIKLVPPLAMREAGLWQIRCDQTEHRRRCALIRSEPVLPLTTDRSTPRTPTLPPVIAHAVLDRVAGRTTVLFRIFIPRQFGEQTSIVVEHGQGPAALPVNRCRPIGCFVEADISQGSEIVRHLWEGQPVSVGLKLGTDRFKAILPALGFRDGVRGLVALDSGEQPRASSR